MGFSLVFEMPPKQGLKNIELFIMLYNLLRKIKYITHGKNRIEILWIIYITYTLKRNSAFLYDPDYNWIKRLTIQSRL